MLNVDFFTFAWQLSVDENELDIPNGENNAENDEEQEQPEVEEQEFYVEGWFFSSANRFSVSFAKCNSLLHVNAYQNRMKTSRRKCSLEAS